MDLDRNESWDCLVVMHNIRSKWMMDLNRNESWDFLVFMHNILSKWMIV